MRSLLNRLLKMFRVPSDKEYAEWYLSQSVDHVDLERRMKELDRRSIDFYRFYR